MRFRRAIEAGMFCAFLVGLSIVGCSHNDRTVVVSIAPGGSLIIKGKVVSKVEAATVLARAGHASQGQYVPTVCFGADTPWSSVAMPVRLCLHYGAHGINLVDTNTQQVALFLASFLEDVTEKKGLEPSYIAAVMDHVVLTEKGIEHDGVVLTNEMAKELLKKQLVSPDGHGSLLAVVVTRNAHISDMMYLLRVCEELRTTSLRIVDEGNAPSERSKAGGETVARTPSVKTPDSQDGQNAPVLKSK